EGRSPPPAGAPLAETRRPCSDAPCPCRRFQRGPSPLCTSRKDSSGGASRGQCSPPGRLPRRSRAPCRRPSLPSGPSRPLLHAFDHKEIRENTRVTVDVRSPIRRWADARDIDHSRRVGGHQLFPELFAPGLDVVEIDLRRQLASAENIEGSRIPPPGRNLDVGKAR